MKSKLLYFTCLLILLYTGLTPLQGQSQQVVTVGYYEDYNLIKNSESIDAKGYGYDLLQKIGRSANIYFKFVNISGSAFDLVNSGEIDIAGLFVKTDEREKNVLFSSMPYDNVQYGLATKTQQHIFYDDPESIQGKTVATYEENYGNVFFDEYLHENNISVQYVYGEAETYTELDTDFYLIHTANDILLDYHTVMNLGIKDMYFISSPKNKELLNIIDETFLTLTLDNRDFVSELKIKYTNLTSDFKHRSLTRTEAEKIRGKTFSVGYVRDHMPYQYTDANANPAGISIDILNMLANEYSFFIDYYPYDFTEPPENHEHFDMLISVTGDKHHDALFYTGTDPYYEVPLVMLLQEQGRDKALSVDDFKDKPNKIGLLDYITFDYTAFYSLYPLAEIVYFQTFDELLLAFEHDEIAAGIFTDSAAGYARVVLGEKGFIHAAGLNLSMKVHIAKQHINEYLDIFNIMIGKLEQRDLYQIYLKHGANFLPDFNLFSYLEENWQYYATGILFIMLIVGIFYFRTKMNEKKAMLKLLRTDDVTNLMSMRYFRELATERLKHAKQHEYEVISIDIDYFKMINKYYGIETGTKVIITMAEALSNAYKNTDSLITRKTSDHFVILANSTRSDRIENIVRKYLEPVVVTVIDKDYNLKLSIGIYSVVDKHESINNMIDFADLARSSGKKNHKITYVYFDEQMRHDFNNTTNIVHRMEHALAEKEFKVVFQPKIDFTTLKISGAEALVRWIPQEGEPIFPDVFIRIMESNGFIANLDLYVFEEVCRFIKENSATIHVPKIAVNLSAITLCEPSITDDLVSTMQKYNIDTKCLELELTESAFSIYEGTILSRLKTLKALGFTIAMDDFGTGASSLNRLSTTDVDVIKLDKSFLDHTLSTEKGTMVIEDFIALSKRLGMKTVSEGVETAEQAQWLQSIKCDIAQGYYFSRPISEADFTNILRTDKTFKIE